MMSSGGCLLLNTKLLPPVQDANGLTETPINRRMLCSYLSVNFKDPTSCTLLAF